MLIVETIAKVRRAFFVQKESIKEICKGLRVSRKVVRKIVRLDATEFHYERSSQPTAPAQVVVRGPKPAMVLHSRKIASDPFTTQEVLATMHGTPLRGKRVLVQRYGETNRELQAALESEGAEVRFVGNCPESAEGYSFAKRPIYVLLRNPRAKTAGGSCLRRCIDGRHK